MGVKITSADKWFSRCVRERAGWRCEGCQSEYPENSAGLQCSHFHGRGSYAVRFDPDNAFAHCTRCHYFFEGNPHEFTRWVRERLGEGAYDILLEKKQVVDNARFARRDVKQRHKSEISRHYREEYRRMQALRKDGDMRRIEFVGYF
ncbi:hypothetical protein [Microbulbifer discodermiae]|uniref:hypothetical protein n=1 Tax=Microbulbifer sp. 2201CG32-9 TaxID=3232309 RepID=UPI00345B5C17